jgi:CD109 antigen
MTLNQITPEWSCFNHTVLRWFPVANISLYRSVFLYEMYARGKKHLYLNKNCIFYLYHFSERFIQVLFNSTPLYVLNICEVCGSYQCPYCPHYSHAALVHLPTFLLVAALAFLLAKNNF